MICINDALIGSERCRQSNESSYQMTPDLVLALMGTELLPASEQTTLLKLTDVLTDLYSRQHDGRITGDTDKLFKSKIDLALDLRESLIANGVSARFLEGADLVAKICAFHSKASKV